MKVGPRALALLHEFEGCRLHAYMPTQQDRPTIGWGMTFYPGGAAVEMGDAISQAQADADFDIIIQRFGAGVAKLIGDAATTPAQFGAMVALAYNIGMGGFAKSSVLRLHKAGEYAGAARAFGLWSKQAGETLPGLVRRRAAEAKLYRGDFT